MNNAEAPVRKLPPTDRAVLLEVAADVIRDALTTGRPQLPDPQDFAPALRVPGATFVTLERAGDLLGCIGTLEPVRPLVVDVAHNALAAAFADPRLPPVTADDFAHMSIKVSVLSDRERVAVPGYAELARAVRPGVDGLVLEAGRHRSTLLPSVWPKVRDAADFLAVLWRKAGLVPGEWRAGTVVSRYTTDEMCDPGPR
jgi:AmmeMemoRadiSam system protein A